MSLGSVHMGRRTLPHAAQTWHQYQTGRALESVNHELIFRQIFAARRPRDSVYDFFVARKKRVHADAKFE